MEGLVGTVDAHCFCGAVARTSRCGPPALVGGRFSAPVCLVASHAFPSCTTTEPPRAVLSGWSMTIDVCLGSPQIARCAQRHFSLTLSPTALDHFFSRRSAGYKCWRTLGPRSARAVTTKLRPKTRTTEGERANRSRHCGLSGLRACLYAPF